MMRNQRRIFTKRFQQQELNDKTQETLQECGADNHIQSLFFTYLSSEVNSTPRNHFVPLKCHIKDKSREPWAIAFQIIIEYLSSNKMNLTLQTMNTEDKKPLQYKSNIVSRLRLSSGYPIIGELLRATASYRRLPLKQRLMFNSNDTDPKTRRRRKL